MVKEVKYGVISDIHEDPRIIVPALEVLKAQGAEKLLINGDIGKIMPGKSLQEAVERSQGFTAFILGQIAESGLEAYVQPGSHETLLGFEPVIEYFSEKYPNLHYMDKPRKVEAEDHDLVFLPGSDVNMGGEYKIVSDPFLFSGKYMHIGEQGRIFKHWQEYVGMINQGIRNGAHSFANMNDLRGLVTSPEKTIVVCHVPRKFDNVAVGVDMARFAEAKIDFVYEGKLVERGSIFPATMIDEGFPLQIREENRGNEDLAKLYDELGIVKAVSGHFHESSHRAHNRAGNPVQEGNYVKDLFWNSGHLDNGYTGILSVRGEEIKYQNIDLRDHIG